MAKMSSEEPRTLGSIESRDARRDTDTVSLVLDRLGSFECRSLLLPEELLKRLVVVKPFVVVHRLSRSHFVAL